MIKLDQQARQWRAISIFLLVWLVIGSFATQTQGQTPTPLRPLPTATPDISATPTPQPNELFVLTSSARTLSEGGSITMTLTPSRRLSRTVTFTLRAGIAVRGDDLSPDTPLPMTRNITFTPTTPRVSFTLSAPDERISFGTNAFVRFVSEGALVGPFDSIVYLDNDAPTLSLSFDRSTIREGNVSGGRAVAIVISNARFNASALQITSSDQSLIFSPVQSLIVAGLPRGQNRYTFTVIAPGNEDLHEPRTAVIRVAAIGAQTVEAPLTILDGDAPYLRLQFEPAVAFEGEVTRVTVKREGNLSAALTVRLSRGSLTLGDLRAFSNLRLAPGQATVQTSIAVSSDGLLTFGRYETVRAEAPGYVTALETLQINNREPRVEALVSPETTIEGQAPAQGVLVLRLSTRFVRAVPLRLGRFGRRLRFVGLGEATSQIVTLPADGSPIRVPFSVIDNSLSDVEADGGTVREGFLYSMPFPSGHTDLQTGIPALFGDATRHVFVNVIDDEAPISLRFSTSNIRFYDFSNLQMTLTVAQASIEAREFVLRLEQINPQSINTFSQEFLLGLPAGSRTVSFPCPTYLSTSPENILRAVVRPREGGPRAAAYATFEPIYSPDVIIAENGPPVPVTLSRPNFTRAETARVFSGPGSRFTVPPSVTFRANQRDINIAVQPINNAQRDGDYFGSLFVPLVNDFTTRIIVIVDDDTLLPATTETPSDAMVVRARLFSPEPMVTGRVGVDILFDTPVTFVQSLFGAFEPSAFALSVNGVPKNSALKNNDILSSGDVRLILQDSALRPGARITLTPINLRDDDGRLLPPIPITLIMPSVLPRRVY